MLVFMIACGHFCWVVSNTGYKWTQKKLVRCFLHFRGKAAVGWGGREEWKLGERRAWGMGECGGTLIFVLLQVLYKWQKQCLPVCIPNRTGDSLNSTLFQSFMSSHRQRRKNNKDTFKSYWLRACNASEKQIWTHILLGPVELLPCARCQQYMN